MKLVELLKIDNRKLNSRNLYEVVDYSTYLFEARSLNKLLSHSKNGFILISAFREYNTKDKNLQLHNSLKSYLKLKKLGFWEVDGMYDYGDGKPIGELTFFIPYNSMYSSDEFLEIAGDLRSKYNQDSVLFWQPELGAYLIYKDKQDFLGSKISFDRLVKIYTKFRNGNHKGRTFTFEGIRVPSNHISALSMKNEGHILNK